MAIRARYDNYQQTGTSSTKVEGVDAVMSLLDALIYEAPEMYWNTLEKYGERIRAGALVRIKDKTGNLRRSFTLKKKKTAKTQRVTISAGGPKAPHAHLVEFGHRQTAVKGGATIPPYYVKGVKYMRKAFEEQIPSLTQELEDILTTLIR